MPTKNFFLAAALLAVWMLLSPALADASATLRVAGQELLSKDLPLVRKAGPKLTKMYRRSRNASLLRSTSPADAADETVAVEILGEPDAQALLSELSAQGLQHGRQRGRIVSGRLPINALEDTANLPGVRFIRQSISLTQSGSTTTQGDTAQRSALARQTFDLDGTGVTIGVLSDSYDCLGGAAADVASGDLPSGVNVLDDYSSSSCTDEGRAMLQLVHDVAPGASLAFATAFGGQAVFADNIVALANAGCDIIVDDVINLAEPMFQDGEVAQAVDQVRAMGVQYYSSAGNGARRSYEATYDASGVALTSIYNNREVSLGTLHDFDPGSGQDFFQEVHIPAGSTVQIVLQWDDPAYSVSGWPGTQTDVDIFLLDSDTATTGLTSSVLESSRDGNLGWDPVEVLTYTNDTAQETFYLALTFFQGQTPSFLKYIIFASSSSVSIQEHDTQSPTCYGHANAAGAVAVGASYYRYTPAYGTDPARIEAYSAAGGVPILFDESGSTLATQEVRLKPELVGPDGGNTTFFGADVEGDGYPNFFGTSASAPHVAAAAALLLQSVDGLTPDQTLTAFAATADDMDDPMTTSFDTGFDYRTGYGLVRTDDAVQYARDAFGPSPIQDSVDVPAASPWSMGLVLAGLLLAARALPGLTRGRR